MRFAVSTFKISAAALLFSAGSAAATLVCPGGQTYPQHGPNDYEFCPPASTPDPVPAGDVTNTITNTANVAAISAAQAKARAKAIAKQRQKQRQRQKQNQRQSQEAYGGAGGAGGAGGSSTVRNVGNVNVEAVANAPTMDPGNSMMGSASGSFLGVSFGRAKADVFPYMLQAAGPRVATAHLANVHGPANKALRANGLAETAKERDARQTREARAKMMFATYQLRPDRTQLTVGFTISYCTVIERSWNGVPSNIYAVPSSSLPVCAGYHGLDLK